MECPNHRVRLELICTKERLFCEIAEIQKTGLAYDKEEREMGLSCVGAAISDYQGVFRYAISISGPTARMQGERLEEIKKNIEEAKKRITAVIGKK